MNNKGFTLVELVAVILVLVAIFLVSFPSIMNMANAEEEKKYEAMVENLCLAGESYIYANTDDFEQLSVADSKIEITVKELIMYGNIAGNLTNPKTNKSVQTSVLTYTVLKDYSLDCEYNED